MHAISIAGLTPRPVVPQYARMPRCGVCTALVLPLAVHLAAAPADNTFAIVYAPRPDKADIQAPLDAAFAFQFIPRRVTVDEMLGR